MYKIFFLVKWQMLSWALLLWLEIPQMHILLSLTLWEKTWSLPDLNFSHVNLLVSHKTFLLLLFHFNWLRGRWIWFFDHFQSVIIWGLHSPSNVKSLCSRKCSREKCFIKICYWCVLYNIGIRNAKDASFRSFFISC